MKTQEFIKHEQLRFDTYRLLANAFYLPDKCLMDSLVALGICMEEIFRNSLKHNNMPVDMGQEDGMELLKVDYAKLFVGPFSLLAPPYGSVYLESERMVMGNSTADVQKWYRASGLDVDAQFKDAPDHIVAELEFMHFLIFKEMEATDQGSANGVIQYLKMQRSFLEYHLGAWISDFADKVVNNAQTTFYRNLTRATKVFVMDDLQTITALLGSWQSDVENSLGFESIQA